MGILDTVLVVHAVLVLLLAFPAVKIVQRYQDRIRFHVGYAAPNPKRASSHPLWHHPETGGSRSLSRAHSGADPVKTATSRALRESPPPHCLAP